MSDYDPTSAIRARLAALPPHLTIEPHGPRPQERLYSCRDQPIDPKRPVSHTNCQHGWSIVDFVPYDSRMWPLVREFIAHAPADIALLLDLIKHLEDENDALHAEIERLTPPESEPHPSVERAIAKFRARLAEVTAERPQEDDGEPE